VKPHEKVIPRFDLVILDPPSFTRNRASVPDALRGYKEIHLRAAEAAEAAVCWRRFAVPTTWERICSRIPALGGVRYAEAFATRGGYSQSPDHPIIPMIPETEYLKGFAYEVAG